MKDFPPEYNTVVRIREQDEEDPPVYDEAVEQRYDIIKSKDGNIELPLEIEVCSESMSPPNHMDCETCSIVKQHEINWETR